MTDKKDWLISVERTYERIVCDECGGSGLINRYYYKGIEIGYDFYCDQCGNYDKFEHPYLKGIVKDD
jgi:hypothetical protein